MKVREVIRLIEADGWRLEPTRESPAISSSDETGYGYNCGKARKGPSSRHTKQHPEAGGIEEMKYAVVIEKSKNGFAAYVPDLPGCVAAGDTLKETENLIREAIEFHIEGMRAHGERVPSRPQLLITSRCLLDAIERLSSHCLLGAASPMPKITPFLWFDHQAEEAMNFYVSIFKISKVLSVFAAAA